MFVSAINISEGRNRRVLEAIAGAASQFCSVWDVHCDFDHHRSVITLSGESKALLQAVEALATEVVTSIDIRAHQGVHPRLGSLDVVPVVPLEGSSLDDAAGIAVGCARRIWEATNIPCFLYGHSAPHQLPDIRRGAFKEIAPDFGNAPHPTAGATTVGARTSLVAFNMNLDTNRLSVARAIATTLRKQMQHVRALGFALNSQNRVQVSCNLLQPGETTIANVFDKTSALALGYGVRVFESEVVGVISKVALGGRSPSSLSMTLHPKLLETISFS